MNFNVKSALDWTKAAMSLSDQYNFNNPYSDQESREIEQGIKKMGYKCNTRKFNDQVLFTVTR